MEGVEGVEGFGVTGVEGVEGLGVAGACGCVDGVWEFFKRVITTVLESVLVPVLPLATSL